MRVSGLQSICERSHNRFPDQALRVKLHWSKICNDERDAPWQIMLGSMSTYYCVLITVGIWLEVFLAYPGAGLNPHIVGFSDDFEGGDRAKAWAQTHTRELFRMGNFDVEEGPLGTHSLCKYGSTTCRNNGVSIDDKDTHGRWRANALGAISPTTMMIRSCHLWTHVLLQYFVLVGRVPMLLNSALLANLFYNVLLHGFKRNTETPLRWCLVVLDLAGLFRRVGNPPPWHKDTHH
jgi:hypothetical protein